MIPEPTTPAEVPRPARHRPRKTAAILGAGLLVATTLGVILARAAREARRAAEMAGVT